MLGEDLPADVLITKSVSFANFSVANRGPMLWLSFQL